VGVEGSNPFCSTKIPFGACIPERIMRARIVLLLASVLVAFAIAELAVRSLAPQQVVAGEHYLRGDDELGWTLLPDYRGRFTNLVDFDTEVRTNSLGLRGPRLSGQRPAVLGLGDSFMFGHGVGEDESFLAVAAQRLGAEAVNAGVPGYDLCQAVDLGARHLPALAVDAIVIAAFGANDEIDVTYGRGRIEVRFGHAVEPGSKFDPSSPRRRISHFVYRHSHLTRMLRHSPVTEAISRWLGRGESIHRRMAQDLLIPYQVPVSPAVVRGGEMTRACLARLSALARSREIPVLGLLVPDVLEIDPESRQRTMRLANRAHLELDLEAPRRRLTKIFGEVGIPLVDPTAALQSASAADRLYFTQDRHFTTAGNRIVGELLATALAPLLEKSTAMATIAP
jgi:hypothetical protein